MASSGNDDLIAGLQENVLFHFISVSNFFVIEVILFTTPHDNDFFGVSELFESTGVHQSLQYSGRKQQRKRSRPADLSLNEVFSAVNLPYLYGDFRFVVRLEFRHAIVDRLG